jgi:hypothetical protein
VVELVQQDQQGDEHGHHHPAEHPGGEHAAEGDQPEPEVGPADGQDLPQRGQVDQPMAATRMMAPRMARARSASSGASTVRASRATAAVTTPASRDLAPARSLTAVLEVPPPAG